MLRMSESWDLTKLPLPPRSLLFPLEPISVGTQFVESLTSYISRLAEVHAVTVSDLVGYVLDKCSPRDAPIVSARARHYRMGSGFDPGIRVINGLAEDARRWIAAVESATDRTGLRFLTLMPLKQIFCKQSLFRNVQAWCPACFADWREEGSPLYFPLSWHLRSVGVCVKHRCSLEETCPHCGKHFGQVCARAKAGFCSRCARWLGLLKPSRHASLQPPDHDNEMWTATCVGDLLAAMAQLEEGRLREILRENITSVVKQVANGNLRVFCDFTGISDNGVCLWLARRQRPRFDQLLHICRRLRIPAAELLRRNGNWSIPAEIVTAGIAASRRSVWRDDPEMLKTALINALTEDPPPSLAHVSLRLDYKTCAPLQRLDPNTCEQIALRYRSHCRRVRRGDKSTSEEIERILKKSLALERPIPVSRIAAEFGFQTECALRGQFLDLCTAIARKQTQNREARHEQLRAGLISAISEEPPPPTGALAQRLGCSHSHLTHYFSDLSRQLRDVRKAWRAKDREAVRQRIEKAATEMHGASLADICRAADVKPIFIYKYFPALYRRIASTIVADRDARRRQRCATLHDEVHKTVAELTQKGLHPTLNKVMPFLSGNAARDWKRIQHEINEAIRERTGKTWEP